MVWKLVVMSAIIWIASLCPAWADCAANGQILEAAAQAGDRSAMETSLARIENDPSCSDTLRADARRLAAKGMVRLAQRNIEAGQQPTEQESLLERAIEVGQVWQAAAMLGDINLDRKAYQPATGYYQRALDLINDPVATPAAPDQAVIERVFRRGAESRMLAETYVPVSTDHRSGLAGGLALEDVRGFGVQEVPLPITFETATATFTEKGRQAASDLAAYLRQQAPPHITLTGHTDERGSLQYNQALSEQRVAAVKAFLEENGFTGEIVITAYGETKPAQLDDPSRYTQEERWQLNRRVELVR